MAGLQSRSKVEQEKMDNISKERIQMLNIFPEEIWIMILAEHLKDHSDLINVNNSCSFFRSILADKRPLFMFPNVWEIVEEKWRKDCHDVYVRDKSQRYLIPFEWNICPCGRNRESRACSTLLPLRLVCRTWTKVMDSFYQTHPYHYQITHNKESDSFRDVKTFELTSYEFSNSAPQVENFISHFSNTHGMYHSDRSPFVGRALEIQFFLEVNPVLEIAVLNLLNKYGKYVWHCIISANVGLYVVRFYDSFKLWLKCMPNLKTLEMCYGPPVTQVLRTEQQLQEQIDLEGLPELEHLQFLRTGFQATPQPILNEIIRKARNISMLSISENVMLPGPTPNLEQLSLTCHTREQFEALESNQENWRLRKLYLKFGGDIFIEWSSVFRLLENKWADTLTDVMIQLPMAPCHVEEMSVVEHCKSVRLHLPNLKRFRVMMSNFSCLDFILPMQKCLEILDIFVSFSIEEALGDAKDDKLLLSVAKEQIIDFVGFTHRLYESNIWELFPSLRKMQFTEDVSVEPGYIRFPDTAPPTSRTYTRDEWSENYENN